jgi:hypothetical protein
LYALKHFFDFLNDHQVVGATPVKPSHVLRRSRALSTERLESLCAQIQHPMDQALFLLL